MKKIVQWIGGFLRKITGETFYEAAGKVIVETVTGEMKRRTEPRAIDGFNTYLRLYAGRRVEQRHMDDFQDWQRRMQGDENGPGFRSYPPDRRRYGVFDEEISMGALNTKYRSFPDTDEGCQERGLWVEWFLRLPQQEKDEEITLLTNDSVQKIARSLRREGARVVEELGVHDAVRQFNDAAEQRLNESAARHDRGRGLF